MLTARDLPAKTCKVNSGFEGFPCPGCIFKIRNRLNLTIYFPNRIHLEFLLDWKIFTTLGNWENESPGKQRRKMLVQGLSKGAYQFSDSIKAELHILTSKNEFIKVIKLLCCLSCFCL